VLVYFECAPPKSCPSKPASPGQGKNLLDGFAQDSTLPSELPHVPNYVNSSEQPDDSTSTRECVTPCSSRESLDSDKRSLNTKFKESMLNATAESFTPLACQRPPHPTVSDGAYYYPNSMLSTTGSGLPVGMGFPELYGSMHVVYNSYNANPESSPQGYTQLSWPQFAQSYGGAPIVYSAEPGSSFPQVYTHPSRAQPLQLYGGAPMAGSLPHGYTHLSRPQSLQLFGGAPMAGPLPQGYTHLSLPQPYGGVPTANSAQPGSFPQGYAHPSWPQQYGR